MRYRNFSQKIFLLLVFLLWGNNLCAQFEYREAIGDTPNPDRGFYQQIMVRDGFDVSPPVHGRSLVRIYFVIDRFLRVDIDDESLTQLDASLAKYRAAGRQAIIRFVYDWPSSELFARGLRSRKAVSASSSQMLAHIQQLGTVLMSVS